MWRAKSHKKVTYLGAMILQLDCASDSVSLVDRISRAYLCTYVQGMELRKSVKCSDHWSILNKSTGLQLSILCR